jgi:GDPmannose 4,6-dehydratase
MRAIITGINGQDGSFLAELLLSKEYEVYGIIRRASIPRYDNIQHLLNTKEFHLIEGDVCDPSSVNKVVNDVQPDEYYNLAAQSHVATSFEQPTTTFNINTLGTLNALEAIRQFSKSTKFYQASTSELFGQNYKVVGGDISSMINPDGWRSNLKKIQDETVPFAPRSPYGASKAAAHDLVSIYRDSYNIFACAGILFNHESSRRGHNFVTRKITRWLGQFANKFSLELANYDVLGPLSDHLDDSEKLRLGNLSAIRDWGHAKDYVRAMYYMLQHSQPEDFVIATGEGHTVEEFLVEAFKCVHKSLDYHDYVVIDKNFYRPAEVDYLQGSSAKARQKLGWKPTIGFKELVADMVGNDLDLARRK